MGPFVTMIYDMIRLDIARFCFIYLIFLISFSQGKFDQQFIFTLLLTLPPFYSSAFSFEGLGGRAVWNSLRQYDGFFSNDAGIF